MVRISSVGSVLLFAASALTLSNADLEYTIRVRNLTYQQPFSPILFVAHTKEVALFIEGLPANEDLKNIAENGAVLDIETIIEEEGIAEYVCGYVVASAPLMAGDTERLTLTVDEDICEGGGVITMASMLVNTNDAFVGFDALNLETGGSSKVFPPAWDAVNTNDAFVGFDSETLKTGGSSKHFPPAWDAGTEENNELCTHIPGPACADTDGNLEAGPGEGYIHAHRGVHGVSGELPSAEYTWLNPVTEVYIAKPVEL